MAVVAIQVHHQAAPRPVPAVHLPAAARHRLDWQQAVPVLRPAHRVRLHQAQALHQARARHQARAAMALVALLVIT